MPTYIIRPERDVTIVLRETPGDQKVSAASLQTLLRSRHIKTQLIIHNPINWEFWDFVVRLARDHGSNAVTAAALLTCVKMWLADRKGRRVEIRRHNLSVKAPTVRELKKTLAAINDYDKLTLELQTPGAPKRRSAKKRAAKTMAKKTPGKVR
jgi:hypothetical protein